MMCWFFALHENKKISMHTDVQFLIYQFWFICGESCSAVIVWKQLIYLWNHFISVEESIIFVIKQTITADVELFRCSGRWICDIQNHIQNSRTRIKFEAKTELWTSCQVYLISWLMRWCWEFTPFLKGKLQQRMARSPRKNEGRTWLQRSLAYK